MNSATKPQQTLKGMERMNTKLLRVIAGDSEVCYGENSGRVYKECADEIDRLYAKIEKAYAIVTHALSEHGNDTATLVEIATILEE